MTPSPVDVAVGQLVSGAFFFAMRSCEYTKVAGRENTERRTKLLRLRNLRFFLHQRPLPLTDPQLHLATSVTITFEMQKNDERNIDITQHRTGDPLLCPVLAWSRVVKRILAYNDCSPESFVCTVQLADGSLRLITSKELLERLRSHAAAMGEATLGFKASEIGTHSIRSGAAMAMYLVGVPVFTIMLIGRWSSDAFLRYIRRQVQEFSAGVAAKMLLAPTFFTVPETPSHHDPRAPGQNLNFSARNTHGPNAHSVAQTPAFSLFH